MLRKGIWIQKLRYFKTGDVFSIYAFFPLCLKAKYYPTIRCNSTICAADLNVTN